jgi:hypothetical protein
MNINYRVELHAQPKYSEISKEISGLKDKYKEFNLNDSDFYIWYDDYNWVYYLVLDHRDEVS